MAQAYDKRASMIHLVNVLTLTAQVKHPSRVRTKKLQEMESRNNTVRDKNKVSK